MLAHALLLLPTFCLFNRHNGEFLRRVAWAVRALSEYSVEKSDGSERPAIMRSLKSSLQRSVGSPTTASAIGFIGSSTDGADGERTALMRYPMG